MKNLFIVICIMLMSGTFIYSLKIISDDNKCTSVRSFLCGNKGKTTTTSTTTTNTTTKSENTMTGESSMTTGTQNTDSQLNTSNNIIDTQPPKIKILNYKDEQEVTDETIRINVEVTDDHTPTKNIIIKGNGDHDLVQGYNPIIVSATDNAGNIGIDYILIYKK